MLQNTLIKAFHRWAWAGIALLLAVWVQPCRHAPGEACYWRTDAGLPVRAFGWYRSQAASDTLSPRLPSTIDQPSAYDSLPDRPKPLVADRLSGR